jgi:hypothetical protein
LLLLLTVDALLVAISLGRSRETQKGSGDSGGTLLVHELLFLFPQFRIGVRSKVGISSTTGLVSVVVVVIIAIAVVRHVVVVKAGFRTTVWGPHSGGLRRPATASSHPSHHGRSPAYHGRSIGLHFRDRLEGGQFLIVVALNLSSGSSSRRVDELFFLVFSHVIVNGVIATRVVLLLLLVVIAASSAASVFIAGHAGQKALSPTGRKTLDDDPCPSRQEHAFVGIFLVGIGIPDRKFEFHASRIQFVGLDNGLFHIEESSGRSRERQSLESRGGSKFV